MRKLKHDDLEGAMAKSQLLKIESYAKQLNDMIHPDDELEAWVQSKLATISAYIGDVKHYMEYELKKYGLGGGIDDLVSYEVEFTWEKESEDEWDGRKVKVMASNIEEAAKKVTDKFSQYYKGFKIVEIELDEDEEYDVVKNGEKVGTIVASSIEVARKKASEWYGPGYEVLEEEEDEDDDDDLSFREVLDKTTFSEGLKDSLIQDLKNSGFEDFSKLKGKTIKETENNIRKRVLGFESNKNTYLQAQAIAEAIHND